MSVCIRVKAGRRLSNKMNRSVEKTSKKWRPKIKLKDRISGRVRASSFSIAAWCVLCQALELVLRKGAQQLGQKLQRTEGVGRSPGTALDSRLEQFADFLGDAARFQMDQTGV